MGFARSYGNCVVHCIDLSVVDIYIFFIFSISILIYVVHRLLADAFHGESSHYFFDNAIALGI